MMITMADGERFQAFYGNYMKSKLVINIAFDPVNLFANTLLLIKLPSGGSFARNLNRHDWEHWIIREKHDGAEFWMVNYELEEPFDWNWPGKLESKEET